MSLDFTQSTLQNQGASSDFYSGVIYRAMGIPSDMYTVMFVLGRLPGWIAQWREMRLMNEPIGRPRQLYTGPAPRKFKSKN